MGLLECDEECVIIAVAEEVEWRKSEERKTRMVAVLEDGMFVVVVKR